MQKEERFLVTAGSEKRRDESGRSFLCKVCMYYEAVLLVTAVLHGKRAEVLYSEWLLSGEIRCYGAH